LVITGVSALAWIAAGFGLFSVIFCLAGLFAPQSVHLF